MRKLAILTLAIVLMMATGASAATSPILDFDLKEGSGAAVVDSANGVVGTAYGTVWTTDPDGQPVLYFDNPIRYWFGTGDRVEIPYHAALNSPAMSIEMLVYPMSAGYYTVFAERIRDGGSWQTITLLGLAATGHHTGTQPQFGLSIGGTSRFVVSPYDIPLSSWSHIVGTYDGDDMSLYVNGELVATELGVEGPRDTGSNPFYMGHAPTSNHHFNGYLDHFKLYDRALTAQEIAAGFNTPPVADANGPYETDEGVPVALDGSASYGIDGTIVTWDWDLDDDGDYDDAFGVVVDTTFPDSGVYSIGLLVIDDHGLTDTDSTVVTVLNVAPAVTVDIASQDVQYSDYIADVTVTATDVPADVLTISTTWSVDGGAAVVGLPGDLALTDSGCTVNSIQTCEWVLAGQITEPAGVYTVEMTVEDGDGGATTVETDIVVTAEDATVVFDGANPVAVEVATPGGNSGLFSLTVEVTETLPDLPVGTATFGEIGLADVSMTLAPVGPGSPSTGTCSPGTVTDVGYDAVLRVRCTFDDVPVNTYTVETTVAGGFYAGYNEDVLVVYDPSLGFTTGGGWFYWPGTDDKTNFGYTMKYKKASKVSGNFLLIRHMDDGSIYRVKSNALYGLAIGEADGFGWASFSGKATYLEPGWDDPIGNHEFVVYVEDHGQPGDGDRVWLEMHDKARDVIPGLSIPRGAPDNAVTISGGNIVVPH